jgi:transcription elongation factor Elf1
MESSKYFLIVVECGHVGRNRSVEVTRYFKDIDIVNAYCSALYMPRSKKKPSSVKEVREISQEIYLLGIEEERNNQYLNTFTG